MAQLLDEIQWGEPILPPVTDVPWEAEVKRRAGRVGGIDRRVAPNIWLREACVALFSYRPSQVPQRLFDIGSLVTAQENSCRYCYGANRAYMKILGYSESFISRIERDAQVAELDDKERAFIAFCRNLARSRPRPAKEERENLIELGYSALTVNEIAFIIALGCFYNRIGVLTACPPELGFERVANGFIGRLIGRAGPLVRAATTPRALPMPVLDVETLRSGAFGEVVVTLAGLSAAAVMKAAMDGAFASTVLSRASKALMFAVVARALVCRRSEAEAQKLLAKEAFDASEVEAAIATLDSARLPANESRLLPWVRATVHYEPLAIQEQTRALTGEIGVSAALEAIGIAALANAMVRLAMLLE